MRPHDHRPPFRRRGGFGPHVEIQTVLAHGGRGGRRAPAPAGPIAWLHAPCAELVRGANTSPAPDRLRRPPAQRTHGRCRKWNAFEHAHAGGGASDARHEPGIDADGIGKTGQPWAARQNDGCHNHEREPHG